MLVYSVSVNNYAVCASITAGLLRPALHQYHLKVKL